MDAVEVYVLLIALALPIAVIVQAFLPRFVANATNWGRAPGWQREIAIWNVAMFVIILGALSSRDAPGTRVVAEALVVLTALLGINHLAALRQGRLAWGHWLAGTANCVAAVGGVIVLWVL